MTTKLFDPYRIGSLELKNRFVRSATRDAMADDSGAVTDDSVALYQGLGQGGVGLIVTGHAFVSPSGQAVPGQYGVHNDDMIPGLHRLVQAAHTGDAKIALQISHAGINSDYFREKGIAAPAVSSMAETSQPHRELTGEEIESIISDFVSATLRAREAGFDAVQLHGAHGYLMSQFQSPLYNFRTDKWGGSAENRRRFHLDVIRAVRQAAGADFPVMIKFGVRDDSEEGLSFSEGLETARRMVQEGIDAIEVSAGIGAPTRIGKRGDPEQTYFRENTAAVKHALAVPVMIVGGIRSLELANNIVDSGDSDLISMCRPFIREPGLIARWQRGEREPATCISCSKCHAIIREGKPLECAVERLLRQKRKTG